MFVFSLTDGAVSHLEGFDESPKQRADALPSAEELHQPHDTEQTKEGDGDAGAVLRVLRRSSDKSGGEKRKKNLHDGWRHTENLAVL